MKLLRPLLFLFLAVFCSAEEPSVATSTKLLGDTMEFSALVKLPVDYNLVKSAGDLSLKFLFKYEHGTVTTVPIWVKFVGIKPQIVSNSPKPQIQNVHLPDAPCWLVWDPAKYEHVLVYPPIPIDADTQRNSYTWEDNAWHIRPLGVESATPLSYQTYRPMVSSEVSGTLKLNDNSFRSVISGSPGLILVDFGTKWCGPCQRIEPVLSSLARELSGTMRIGVIDCDESPEASGIHRIGGIPCLVLFKDGVEIARTLGYHSREELTSWLDNHLPKSTIEIPQVPAIVPSIPVKKIIEKQSYHYEEKGVEKKDNFTVETKTSMTYESSYICTPASSGST